MANRPRGGIVDYHAYITGEGNNPETPTSDVKYYPYAGTIRRFIGFGFLDTLVIVFVYGALAAIYGQHPQPRALAIGGLVIAAYFVVGYKIGGTLGHYFTGTRVVRADNASEHINWLRAILRLIALTVEVFLSWIPLLYVYTNPERRTLHDKLGGSCVIRVRRNWREISERRGLGE